jgi:hypothetical protein
MELAERLTLDVDGETDVEDEGTDAAVAKEDGPDMEVVPVKPCTEPMLEPENP